MKKFNKIIFGKKYEITVASENAALSSSVEEQLSYYEDFSADEKAETEITITTRAVENEKPLSVNPSIHRTFADGFEATYSNYSVRFAVEENATKITLKIKPSGGAFATFLRKVNNMEFATREERGAQILFESALVPSVFFDADLFPVHSSGFAKNGKGILIGGTGGSGKTSLELELCINRNFTFLNDDIAIVNNEGLIFPNLAHPKIYGYNLESFPELREMLFDGKSATDKFFWQFREKFFGKNKVRRRLFVKNFDYTNEAQKLNYYFVLVKENTTELATKKIDGKTAADLHLNVIAAEYYEFINHLRWHEFNSRALDIPPKITHEKLIGTWRKNAEKVFAETENYIISIPEKIEHKTFLEKASKIISEIAGV